MGCVISLAWYSIAGVRLVWLWISMSLCSSASSLVEDSRTVTMLSQPDIYVANTGEDLELSCHFHMNNFDLFDNPVIWTKSQRDEHSSINIMGNIVPPFLATERFDANLKKDHPRYDLKLLIKDLSLEDSGNYTCEVRGERSVALSSVTVSLFVRAPVQAIAVTSDNGTAMTPRYTNTLTFIEGQPGTLRCISLGGYPPPDIQIFLANNTNITSAFSLTYSSSLSGAEGLRLMLFRTERWTHDFAVSGKDDGKLVQCVVTVPGLGSNISVIKLHILYAPIIECFDASAQPGDKNAYVRCEVRARPRATALFWILDINGTKVKEGRVVKEHWTIVTDRGEHLLETKLYMRQANQSSFRRYTLEAENTIGTTRKEVQLFRDELAAATAGPGDAESVSSSNQHANPEYKVIMNASTSQWSIHIAPILTALVIFAISCIYQS